MPNKYLMHKQMRKDMDMRMNDRNYQDMRMNDRAYGNNNDMRMHDGAIYEQHPNQSYFNAQKQHDGRNPYGAKGGYVDSYGGYNAMDYNQYDSRGYDRAYGRDGDGYHFHGNPEYNKPNAYQMYAQVTPQMYPMPYGMDMRRGDYGDYNDYNMDGNAEQKYHEDLKKLCKKLEKHNKFPNVRKEEVLKQTKQMGVPFDKFNEEEFMCAYYLMMAEHPMDLLNSPQAYMIMAKDWLKSKATKYKGSDKLAAYYYEIVKGGKSSEEDDEEDD